MFFVTGPLTFSWVKVMAKWYHENGIKTPYPNLSPCAFYLT